MHDRDLFRKRGYSEPLNVAGSVLDYMREELTAVDSEVDLSKNYRTKCSVIYRSVFDFVQSQDVVQLVRDFIGDFHCWDVMLWTKRPESEYHVSAHHDALYWNFAPKPCGVTLWVPLQDVGLDNGSLEYSPGSHRKIVSHVDRSDSNNLLLRGQSVVDDLPYSAPIELSYGQAVMHHAYTVHRSAANPSTGTRRALSFKLVGTYAKPLIAKPSELTTFVCGSLSEEWLCSPIPDPDWRENVPAWQEAHDVQLQNYKALK